MTAHARGIALRAVRTDTVRKRYLIRGLPAGRYRVSAHAKKNDRTASAEIEAEAGATTAHLDLELR